MNTKTETSLIGAWSERAGEALDLLAVAGVAPALVKPAAIAEAAQTAAKARQELDKLAGRPAIAPVPLQAFLGVHQIVCQHFPGIQGQAQPRGAFWSFL